MKTWMLFVVLCATVLAIAFAYSASTRQRLWRRPLAVFPARATAILAAIVALKAWTEALGAMPGLLAWLAWLATVVIAVLVLLRIDTHPGAAAPR